MMERVTCEREARGIVLKQGGYRTRVEAIDAAILHVVHTGREAFASAESLMVVGDCRREAAWEVVEEPEAITLRTEKLQLRVDAKSGAFTWMDAAGELLVREPERGGKHLADFPVEKRIFDESIQIRAEATSDGIKARVEGAKVVIDRTAYTTKLELEFAPGEAIYGLGQHEEGILNYRGKRQYLYQQNLKVAMPVIVSTRGYGILWDTTSLATFHDDEQGTYFWTECDDEMDFYFTVGPEFDQIVAGLRRLTGRPSMLPRWAFGYVQSKERYRTQEELIEVVKEYRRRGLPIDCIVQDWLSWAGNQWGNKRPDAQRYPDVDALTRELHALDARLMVSIWPVMRGECEDQIEMRRAGFLLGNDATYDAFNPEARRLYWEQANRGWFSHGSDAWWCDCTEPFEADWKGTLKPEPWKRVIINTGESKTFLDPERINAYSLAHSRGIWENQRASGSAKRVVNLTRSGYPGQQRYGTITWSGDTAARWEVFRRQIADGLNFCITGNPRWTIDIGAFFAASREQWFWRGDYPGGCEDPAYREQYVRWFQFGAFLPMFRAHGTDTPREIWRFGEPGEEHYEALLKMLKLRYRLLPYIYSCAAAETFEHYTMMRMLAFDFRHDSRVHDIDDQYVFGRGLMVCPVTRAGASSRAVYLPAGCDWHDFWTGERHSGGQQIEAEAPIDRLPLFVRAGSIIPLGPEVQHANEKRDAPIELRVYPGADGAFTLYEDAGYGWGYERGEYATTRIAWDENRRKLIIEPRRGSYPGMLAERDYRAIVMEARA